MKLSKKQQRVLRRILISGALLAAITLARPALSAVPLWPAYLVPYLIIGYDVLRKALLGIRNGQVFDENFLMALATVGAFGTGEYAEAVFVMLFYQVGELFQDYAVGKSRQSIAQLMDIRPDTANLLQPDGSVSEVDPEDVAVGQIVVIKPGERVPLDGTVRKGASALDTAALTGESLPRDVTAGDPVISGCINLSGLLEVEVTKPCSESTVSRILELVELSADKKARSEQFITRFARYYTPCVVLCALALFAIPSAMLAFGSGAAFLTGTVWTDWLHRALIFLVISCPCALVISVPMSFFGGIGGAGKRGILVKGGTYLELLAQADTVVFDKTGTLTRGQFTVTDVQPQPGFTRQEVIELAALCEQWSDHPISAAIRAAAGEVDAARVTQPQELAGHGVRAAIDGRSVAAGNRRLMAQEGVALPENEVPGTAVYVAVNGALAGVITVGDTLKPDAREAIAALKDMGVKRTVMLTGDGEAAAAAVARELGVDEYHARLLPVDKVNQVERLLGVCQGKLIFVGDGINDAPVLTRADVGIAMGALGADAAIEAADVVLMDDKPSRIATAMAIARKTVGIVRQNIVFALGVKFAVLILGALGYASMWWAVFADVGVAVIAILNASRALS